MIILDNIKNLPNDLAGCVCAIGNFDGVHIGHQHLISKCVQEANRLGRKSCIITFSPHPSEFFKASSYQYLYAFEDKVSFIRASGADYLLVISFDKSLSELNAKEFIELYICNHIKAYSLFTGDNFKFGKGREGDAAHLAEYAKKYGFKYTPIPGVYLYDSEVSSSSIKHLLATGQVAKSAKLLGKYFTISGVVSTGKRREGKDLGWPTANISLNQAQITPILGAYFVEVRIDNDKLFGVANIVMDLSSRENHKNCSLEVHIFNFNQDIYNKAISVSFISLLRLERRCSSLETLKAQIDMDIKLAKYLARNLEYLPRVF